MKLGLNTVSLWFGIIMMVVVLSGAIALTVSDLMSDRLYGSKRVGFIIMLFALGNKQTYKKCFVIHIILNRSDQFLIFMMVILCPQC